VISSDEYAVGIDNKDVAVLKYPILISTAENFGALSGLVICGVDGKQ
jgi:hypothetical protein